MYKRPFFSLKSLECDLLKIISTYLAQVVSCRPRIYSLSRFCLSWLLSYFSLQFQFLILLSITQDLQEFPIKWKAKKLIFPHVSQMLYQSHLTSCHTNCTKFDWYQGLALSVLSFTIYPYLHLQPLRFKPTSTICYHSKYCKPGSTLTGTRVKPTRRKFRFRNIIKQSISVSCIYIGDR